MRTCKELIADLKAKADGFNRLKEAMIEAKARCDQAELSRLIDQGIREGWELLRLYEESSKA